MGTARQRLLSSCLSLYVVRVHKSTQQWFGLKLGQIHGQDRFHVWRAFLLFFPENARSTWYCTTIFLVGLSIRNGNEQGKQQQQQSPPEARVHPASFKSHTYLPIQQRRVLSVHPLLTDRRQERPQPQQRSSRPHYLPGYCWLVGWLIDLVHNYTTVPALFSSPPKMTAMTTLDAHDLPD
jgi:hypothetical protein